jgi:hypothetical protein
MQVAPQKTSQQTYRTLFWLFLALITIFRLLLADKFGLGVDESHYLLYSRHLAWGYFDHPPMVAFLAALTTLFGESVFWVRLGPILCSTASLILLRYLVLTLYQDERLAFGSAVLLQMMPYQHLLMVALLPDATLNLFWCGTLLAVWKAIKTGKWSMWILSGLLFGGTLLSKYHGVLLAGCLLGYFITSGNHRFWLQKLQPYIAALIGLAVFMPNILWNSSHDWISYSYQLGQSSGDGVSPTKFLLAIAGQFGVWSPLIFGLLIAAIIVLVRQKKISDADRFIVWTSIPIFIFFCLAGVTGKILPHWTSAGWWTGSIALSLVISGKRSRPNTSAKRWRRWSVAAALTGLVMSTLLYVVLFWPIVAPVYNWARDISVILNRKFPVVEPLKPYETGYDLSNELFGWEQIADGVEAIRTQMPRPEKTFVFCHRFHTTSQLAVYLTPGTAATSLYHKASQYRFWFSAEKHAGWDALFVVDQKRHRKRALRYLPLFAKMDPEPVKIQIFRDDQLSHDLAVYKYYGFKGEYENLN